MWDFQKEGSDIAAGWVRGASVPFVVWNGDVLVELQWSKAEDYGVEGVCSHSPIWAEWHQAGLGIGMESPDSLIPQAIHQTNPNCSLLDMLDLLKKLQF